MNSYDGAIINAILFTLVDSDDDALPTASEILMPKGRRNELAILALDNLYFPGKCTKGLSKYSSIVVPKADVIRAMRIAFDILRRKREAAEVYAHEPSRYTPAGGGPSRSLFAPEATSDGLRGVASRYDPTREGEDGSVPGT